MRPFTPTTSKLDTQKSIRRAREASKSTVQWRIQVRSADYVWSSQLERVALVRKGLPYESIEVISKRADLPVKQMLNLLGVPQTTYNKKKKDEDLLNGRDSEMILLLTELLDFGQEVFNGEREKFTRWLKKPNVSLGGLKPESLFDTITGIQEVKNSLTRLEYGNMA